jgi:glycerophosphoryl diester phosphodiesterase
MQPDRRPIIVAHRGNSQVAPENTLAAFRSAVALGVDAVEMDLRLSRDGRLVLMHDATVDRTTGAGGEVAELTLSEIQRLDAGSWKDSKYAGEAPPTFEDAARLLAGKCLIFAEFKVPELAGPVAEIAGRSGVLEQLTLLIWGKHPWNLEDARRELPECPVYELGEAPAEATKGFFAERRAAGVAALNYKFKTLTPEFVGAARARELPVLGWTINRPAQVERALEMGLAGITTDDPALVQDILSGS